MTVTFRSDCHLIEQSLTTKAAIAHSPRQPQSPYFRPLIRPTHTVWRPLPTATEIPRVTKQTGSLGICSQNGTWLVKNSFKVAQTATRSVQSYVQDKLAARTWTQIPTEPANSLFQQYEQADFACLRIVFCAPLAPLKC